jgi:hypothetical protein
MRERLSNDEVDYLVLTFWRQFPPFPWEHYGGAEKSKRARAFAASIGGLVGVDLADSLGEAVAAASTSGWDPDDLLPRFIEPAAEATGDPALVDRVTSAFQRSFGGYMADLGVSVSWASRARPTKGPAAVEADAEETLARIGASEDLSAFGAAALQSGYSEHQAFVDLGQRLGAYAAAVRTVGITPRAAGRMMDRMVVETARRILRQRSQGRPVDLMQPTADLEPLHAGQPQRYATDAVTSFLASEPMLFHLSSERILDAVQRGIDSVFERELLLRSQQARFQLARRDRDLEPRSLGAR